MPSSGKPKILTVNTTKSLSLILNFSHTYMFSFYLCNTVKSHIYTHYSFPFIMCWKNMFSNWQTSSWYNNYGIFNRISSNAKYINPVLKKNDRVLAVKLAIFRIHFHQISSAMTSRMMLSTHVGNNHGTVIDQAHENHCCAEEKNIL